MKNQNDESILFFPLPDMQHIQAVSGTGIKNAFPRHVHSTFCIGIIDKGSRIISRKGISALIPENSLFVISPGESHTCRPGEKQGHSYRIICADEHIMRSTASQISEKPESIPVFENVLISDKQIEQDIRQFFLLIDQPGSTLARESVLMSLLSGLILRHAETRPIPCQIGSQDRAVRRVQKYIEKNYAENLSLKQLASVACLSQFHFQRVFLKDSGVSPNEYLVQFRIKKARELLLQGVSLADTALEVGFADQSHFTKFFKRVVGVTPGKYLRQNKAEQT